MSRQVMIDKCICAVFGCIIGSTLGAEVALIIRSPVLGIVSGGASGLACGWLVAAGRMSSAAASFPFAMTCVTVICFNGTSNSVVGGTLIGIVIAAVVTRLPQAVSFFVFGALLGTAILAIPCSSFGRPISEWLVGARQWIFVATMAIAGLGVWSMFRFQKGNRPRDANETNEVPKAPASDRHRPRGMRVLND